MAYWDKATKIWAFRAEKRLNNEMLAADEFGHSTHFFAALAFLKSNFYGLVAPLSAEMGWGCQCCEILQAHVNPSNINEMIGV